MKMMIALETNNSNNARREERMSHGNTYEAKFKIVILMIMDNNKKEKTNENYKKKMKVRNISKSLCSTTDLWVKTRCCSLLLKSVTDEEENVSVRSTAHFLALKLR
jgi:hypothetical protein